MKKLFSFFLSALLLSLFPLIVSANDSAATGMGGRWRMLKGEHRQVQMVSEHVRIVQQKSGDFLTTADFVFRNHGPATTVKMGFPEEKVGDAAYDNDRVSLHHFKTWVNGSLVEAQRQKITERNGDFLALWVKTVHFKQNATRRVRVRYLSASGGGSYDGNSWVSYNFTGGNWRGKVHESILDIRFLPGWYLFGPYEKSTDKPPTISRKNARFRFRWTNWEAQQQFMLDYKPIFPNELALSIANSNGISRDVLVIESGNTIHRGIPYASDSNSSILWKGQLWVHAQNLTNCEWKEKRKGMILRLGKRAFFVSTRGLSRRSSYWQNHPDRPFWLNVRGENRLYIPARLVVKKLGGKFTLYKDKSIYRNGRYKKVLD